MRWSFPYARFETLPSAPTEARCPGAAASSTRAKSRRRHEPASRAVAGILAPVCAGAGVTVDEDASVLVRRVLEARVCRVRTEEQRVTGLRQDGHGIGLAKRGALVGFEVDSSPFRAARHELERTAVGRHLVEHDQRLHEAAAAVDVRPGAVAFVAMLDVLMPAEYDAVVRALEVDLAQKMVHRAVVEQLRTRSGQSRVAADVEQVTLASAGPDDALNDLSIGAAAEHEIRSAMQRGFGESARDSLELVEARSHARDLVGAEQRSADDPAELEEVVDLIGAQSDFAAHGRYCRRRSVVVSRCSVSFRLYNYTAFHGAARNLISPNVLYARF